MRAIVTGQVGMDKKQYLEQVVRLAGERGERIDLYNVGDMMYAEAPDLRAGRILDLPLSRLNALRRAAIKDIINQSVDQPNILVNTHATFRWRHGLFGAFDFDQARALAPDTLICLVDNIEVVHHRLHREHHIDATLKDLMVWREEEILATELLAQALGCANRFYVFSRGRDQDSTQTCYHLVCRPRMRKVYPSFPMTHVAHMPVVRAEIDAFRAELAHRFIAFDPGEVDEKLLLDQAIAAAKEGRDFVASRGDHAVDGGSRASATASTDHQSVGEKSNAKPLRVSVKQVLDIAGDIDGQIYMRDFKLIDQSDMIVSLVPEIPAPDREGEAAGGMPGLSSGVERELHHAFEHGKEVYVVWKPARPPSPFITETATKVFRTTQQALDYFEHAGMFAPTNLFGQ